MLASFGAMLGLSAIPRGRQTEMIGPATQPTIDFWYGCRVVSVHDGDTCTVNVDLGFFVRVEQPLRLLGVNAPELANKDGSGQQARQYTADWVATHLAHAPAGASWPFSVQYVHPDKYAPRFDGVLVCGQNHTLNDDLLSSGNAVVMS